MIEALSFWHRQPRLATGTGANGETLYSQVTTAQYDALNRVTYSEDPEQFRIWYRYDEVGNRRQVYGQYRNLEDQNLWEAQSFWYAFDAMNRFTVTQGSLAWTGTEYLIVRGGTGTEIAYNGLGQRVETINSLYSEQYSYDDFGYLTETIISSGWTATRSNDRQGRTLDYQEENAAGKVKNHSTYTHDGDNRVLTEKAYDDGSTDSGKRIQTTTNTYDAAGNQVESEVDYRFNSINTITTSTEYQYWGAGNYKQTEVEIAGATAYWPDYRWQPGTAVYHYDVNGHLRQVEDEQGGRVVDFVNNAQGQILRREESKYDSSFTISSYGTLQYTEKANLFYLNGIVIGEVNTSGPSRQDYGSQIASSMQAGRDAKNLTKLNSSGNYGYSNLPDFIRPVMFADLDQNYQPIGRDYPSKVPGAYTVQGGETLADVARSVWGDSSLWYLIAEANGLKGSETLLQGTVLKLPNVVTNVHNNADTFRPYEPGRVIGDVAPTLPDAPSQAPEKPDDKGGIVGLVMQIVGVILIVVGAVLSWLGIGTALVSIGVNLLTYSGVANAAHEARMGRMSWGDALAQAAVSYVSGYVGGVAGEAVSGAIGGASGAFVGGIVQGATTSVVSQGLNIALGYQDQFSWRDVAIGGIAGGFAGLAMYGVNKAMMPKADPKTGKIPSESPGQQMARQATSVITAEIVREGVRAAMYGSDYEFDAVQFAGSAAGSFGAAFNKSAASGVAVEASSKTESSFLDAIGDAFNSVKGWVDTALTAIGEGIGNGIVNTVGAAGDVFGFDGQFGYQGDEGRSLSFAGLGDAFGEVFAPDVRESGNTPGAQIAQNIKPLLPISIDDQRALLGNQSLVPSNNVLGGKGMDSTSDPGEGNKFIDQPFAGDKKESVIKQDTAYDVPEKSPWTVRSLKDLFDQLKISIIVKQGGSVDDYYKAEGEVAEHLIQENENIVELNGEKFIQSLPDTVPDSIKLEITNSFMDSERNKFSHMIKKATDYRTSFADPVSDSSFAKATEVKYILGVGRLGYEQDFWGAMVESTEGAGSYTGDRDIGSLQRGYAAWSTALGVVFGYPENIQTRLSAEAHMRNTVIDTMHDSYDTIGLAHDLANIPDMPKSIDFSLKNWMGIITDIAGINAVDAAGIVVRAQDASQVYSLYLEDAQQSYNVWSGTVRNYNGWTGK